MISFFLLPKGVLHKLDYYRSIVCSPKDQGGLGIHDLEVKNRALLGKCMFKLLTEEGAWQTILKRKYIGQNMLSQVFWKPGDSHFWAKLMATKKFFLWSGFFFN
jgi:hypothetical protein